MESNCKKYAGGVGQKIIRIGGTPGNEMLVEFIGQTVQKRNKSGPYVYSADSRHLGRTGESPDGQQAEDEVFDAMGQFIDEGDIQSRIGQTR